MLCDDCHVFLHEGTIPLRFAFAMKLGLREAPFAPVQPGPACPETLMDEITRIGRSPLTPGAKFTLLNDVLIDANFLTSERGRILVFAHALLAKASVLNDGTPPVRASLQATLDSMTQRRAWAAMLATRAAKYGSRLDDNWLQARGRHVVAVCHNARNRFEDAVKTHRKLLSFIDGMKWNSANRDGIDLFRARIVREMAVCMAKKSHLADAARLHTMDSHGVARAVGMAGDVDDALVRCCEAETFLGDLRGARRHLDDLYSDWHRMTDNLRAITLKLDARLAMAAGDRAAAEKLIDSGADWCATHGVHHQAYHFARLRWNVESGMLRERSAYLT